MGASAEQPTSYPPNVIFFSQEKDEFHIDSTNGGEWGGGSVLYLMVAVKDTGTKSRRIDVIIEISANPPLSGIGISQTDQAKLFERFRYVFEQHD